MFSSKRRKSIVLLYLNWDLILYYFILFYFVKRKNMWLYFVVIFFLSFAIFFFVFTRECGSTNLKTFHAVLSSSCIFFCISFFVSFCLSIRMRDLFQYFASTSKFRKWHRMHLVEFYSHNYDYYKRFIIINFSDCVNISSRLRLSL